MSVATAPNAGMTLVFRDDFKGPAGSPPDPAKWSVYNGRSGADFVRSPTQIALDGEPDGHCVITAINQAGSIVTGGMAAKLPAPLLYGYIEVRMYAVADPTGFTDAVALLWPDDGDWPAHGEVDYYEAGNAKRTVSSFLHYSAQNLFLYQALGIVGTGWHTVGVLWTAEDVVVYVDGKVAPGWNVKPTPAAAVPQWPMHPTLQLDVNPGTPAGAKLKRPVKMVVDYLAVWAPVAPPPPPPPGPPALPAAPVGPFTQYTTRQIHEGGAPVTLSKIQVSNVPDFGVLVMDWPPQTPPPATLSSLTDILTENIGPDPSAPPGTDCAGIWVGQPATAERIWGDGTWEGLWTGCNIGGLTGVSSITDFTCAKMGADGKPSGPLDLVGLYMEHCTFGVKFTNGYLWANGNNGNSEWWYTDSGYAAYVESILGSTWAGAGKAGSWGNYFKNVSFYCPANGVGMFEDAGTFGNTYDGCYFWGPGAGIGLPNNRLGPLSLVMPNCVFVNKGVNIYYHDNAIGIAKGAAQPGRPLHPHTLRNK